MNMKKYRVLKKDGYTGLTVGSHVREPGDIFLDRQWPYGEEALKRTIKDDRCELISGGEKDDKKQSKSSSKAEL